MITKIEKEIKLIKEENQELQNSTMTLLNEVKRLEKDKKEILYWIDKISKCPKCKHCKDYKGVIAELKKKYLKK